MVKKPTNKRRNRTRDKKKGGTTTTPGIFSSLSRVFGYQPLVEEKDHPVMVPKADKEIEHKSPRFVYAIDVGDGDDKKTRYFLISGYLEYMYDTGTENINNQRTEGQRFMDEDDKKEFNLQFEKERQEKNLLLSEMGIFPWYELEPKSTPDPTGNVATLFYRDRNEYGLVERHYYSGRIISGAGMSILNLLDLYYNEEGGYFNRKLLLEGKPLRRFNSTEQKGFETPYESDSKSAQFAYSMAGGRDPVVYSLREGGKKKSKSKSKKTRKYKKRN